MAQFAPEDAIPEDLARCWLLWVASMATCGVPWVMSDDAISLTAKRKSDCGNRIVHAVVYYQPISTPDYGGHVLIRDADGANLIVQKYLDDLPKMCRIIGAAYTIAETLEGVDIHGA